MFFAIFLFYIAKKAWLTTTIPEVILGKQKSTRKIHLSYILVKKTMFKRLGVSSFQKPFKAFGLRKRRPFCRFHPFPLSLLDPKSNSLLRTTPAARNARSYGENTVQPTIRFAPPENERIRPTKKDHFIWK